MVRHVTRISTLVAHNSDVAQRDSGSGKRSNGKQTTPGLYGRP